MSKVNLSTLIFLSPIMFFSAWRFHHGEYLSFVHMFAGFTISFVVAATYYFMNKNK